MKLTSGALGIGNLSILFKGFHKTLEWTDEVAGLERSRTSSAENDCFCVTTNDSNLFQTLFLEII